MTLAQTVSNLKALIGPGIEVGDADLKTWVNDAYGYMCDEITKANPDYFTKTAYTQTVNGQQEYELPTDFERMLMVNLQYSGVWSRALPLQTGINQVAVWSNPNMNEVFTVQSPRYYIYGNTPMNIGFLPIPTDTTASGLKIWYAYTPIELSADSDTPVFPTKYHHILKYLAYATYLDEDDEHGPAEAMRNRYEERVAAMCETMTDTQLDDPKSIVITNTHGLYRRDY